MIKPLPMALRDAFEAFWAAYPARRPNPRRAAETAFAAAVARGADPAALPRAAARYAAECRHRAIAEAYIPHARTWLAQERYADYPDPTEPAARTVDRSVSQDPLVDRLIAGGIPAPAVISWFARVQLLIADRRLTVTTESAFVADVIKTRFEADLQRIFGLPVLYRWPGGPRR